MKTTTLLAALTLVALPLLAAPAAACEGWASSESWGDWNESEIDVSGCGQASHYQDGDRNRAKSTVRGRSQVVTGQFRSHNRSRIEVDGSGTEGGVMQYGGAETDVRVVGDRNGFAIFNHGGVASLEINGSRNITVIKVRP